MAHVTATVETFGEKLAELRKQAHKYPVFVVWTGMKQMFLKEPFTSLKKI